jgi:hypothetical protein
VNPEEGDENAAEVGKDFVPDPAAQQKPRTKSFTFAVVRLPQVTVAEVPVASAGLPEAVSWGDEVATPEYSAMAIAAAQVDVHDQVCEAVDCDAAFTASYT